MSLSPPLIELLGAGWDLGAPVAAAAWSADDAIAGFGLGDGSVVFARAAWDGGPEVRPRDGGVEVVPPRVAAPPVSRTGVHQGACLALAAATDGFVSGGDDGRMVRVATDGAATELATFPGERVARVAAGASGWCAGAAGRALRLAGGGERLLSLPADVTALAFDASGRRLAIAHAGGVSLWTEGEPGLRRLGCAGAPRSVAWSPDAAVVVAGLQDHDVQGWRVSDAAELALGAHPARPGSLSFAADGAFLAAAGAPRVVCWHFDPAASEPTECGLPSTRAPVRVVACHPVHALIAAGYANGAVLLCQPGVDDVLFAKGAGGGAVTSLAWSRQGGHLAIGTADGAAGLVLFPDRLLRRDAHTIRERAA